MNLLLLIKSIFPSQQTTVEELIDTSEDIDSLSIDVLSPPEIEEAQQLTKAIISGRLKKRRAISILQRKIGFLPKRPIYYITLQYLPYLPNHTREIMRYLGDYIDGLVKYTACDLLDNKKYLSKSLGTNLHNLKEKLPQDLIDKLFRYNEVIYVPAKHDFKVVNRKHRFSCREVVFACIITVSLADKLKSFSHLAQQFANDTLPKEY